MTAARISSAALACLAFMGMLAFGLATTVRPAWSQTSTFSEHLVADLSERFISITLGFAGTDLLLFGATDGTGDVVIIVRGPATDVTVRRKARIGGIWVNRDHVAFEGIPGYYLVASTGPLDEIVPEGIRRELEIGLDALPLEPVLASIAQPIARAQQGVGDDQRAAEPPEQEDAAPATNPTEVLTGALTEAEREAFRAALIRNKQRQGLYIETPGSVTLQSGRLFRTKVVFPSNVPTGNYAVDVILMRDGHVVGMTTTGLGVDRRGFESLVFLFAHRRPISYGVIAIVIALVAGWFAGFVFRKL
ncbi:MAG: TIGR02186 family protein [Alphaproteobacteria bacterium]|nr:TIGR02186 family protein [Alphaproteobacteria bacterium]